MFIKYACRPVLYKFSPPAVDNHRYREFLNGESAYGLCAEFLKSYHFGTFDALRQQGPCTADGA
ncbi:hypothetical protein FACS189491_03170 [Spirochaetia bacterium]|nr:hypothetical protein FACS189491_03170 [Spirochaetia bacterium]